MAPDTLRNAAISLIVITVFVFAMISFLTQMGNEYGRDMTELEKGSRFNATDYNQSIQDTFVNSSSWREGIEDWGPLTIVSNIYNVGKNILNFLFAPLQIITNTLHNVFKIPLIIINAAWAIIVLTVIFALFRLIKQGD